jgi:hypothetical protein
LNIFSSEKKNISGDLNKKEKIRMGVGEASELINP